MAVETKLRPPAPGLYDILPPTIGLDLCIQSTAALHLLALFSPSWYRLCPVVAIVRTEITQFALINPKVYRHTPMPANPLYLFLVRCVS